MITLQKIRREKLGAQFVFLSERNAPMTDLAFRKMLDRTGEAAKYLGLPIHPHMLRHSCRFKLANDGHDTQSIQFYLGTETYKIPCPTHKLVRTDLKGFGKINSEDNQHVRLVQEIQPLITGVVA